MFSFPRLRTGVLVAASPARRLRDLGPCLVLTGLWFVLFLPLLTGHRVIPYDSIDEFYATVHFNSQSLRHGQWPWWNPYVYSGYPQIADPQGMMFSPLLMFLMVVRENPGVVWFDFCVLVHVLIGGWGFLLLCRAFALTSAASVFAALIYIVGGVASARLQHTPMVLAYACFPWGLYCCQRFTGAPTGGKAVALGISSGIQLVHLVQTTYLFMLFALLYFVIRLVELGPRATKSMAVRLVGGVAAAFGIAAAIAGVQISATLAMLPLSTRGAFAFDTVAAASLAPRALTTLVWPNVYGTLDGAYSGTQDITESYFYVGIIPLCFLCCYLYRVLADPAQRAAKAFFVVSLLLACAFFLGTNTPLYRVLYDYLPGIRLFRRPSDGAYLFNFCLAALTGFAVSGATRPAHEETTARVGLRVLPIAATWYFIIAALEWARGLSYLPILALGVAASILIVAVAVPKRPNDRVIVVGFLVLCASDVRVFNLPNRLNAHGADAARYFDNPGGVLRKIKADPRPLAGGLPFRIEPTQAGGLSATGTVIHGLESTQGYNPLRVRLYAMTFGAQEAGNVPRPFTAALPSLDSPLFDLSGTRYVLSATPIEILAAGNRHGRFENVMSEDNLTLWRNQFAYNRILTPIEARVMPVDEPPTAMHFDGVDFSRTLLLYPGDVAAEGAARQTATACHGKTSLSEIDFSNNHVSFKSSASERSWVAISDVYFPGWEAQSDDQPLRIWRANGLYRAVCVPAGDHRVRLTFRAWKLIRTAFH